MKGCTVIALMYSGARKTPTDMILLKPDKLQKCTHARHARRRHMKTLTDHEYLTACEVDHVDKEFLYQTPDANARHAQITAPNRHIRTLLQAARSGREIISSMKTSHRMRYIADPVHLTCPSTGNMLVSCAGSKRSTRPVSTCDRTTMGAARPPCAGGPYRTARCQAADGHDHALTDGQRKRAARTLTGAMVPRRPLSLDWRVTVAKTWRR